MGPYRWRCPSDVVLVWQRARGTRSGLDCSNNREWEWTLPNEEVSYEQDDRGPGEDAPGRRDGYENTARPKNDATRRFHEQREQQERDDERIRCACTKRQRA